MEKIVYFFFLQRECLQPTGGTVEYKAKGLPLEEFQNISMASESFREGGGDVAEGDWSNFLCVI